MEHPDLSCLPIEAYQKLNKKQHPDRNLILGVTSTKGCNYGCKYCGASLEEGKVARYGVVNKIVDWGNTVYFPCTIQLWSPDIMSNIIWLKEFVNSYEQKNCIFPWRAVARLSSIDEEKMNVIFQHNCKEIAVGIEMIKKNTYNSLKADKQQLFQTIKLFEKFNIKLKCLLMLGYPGFEIDDVKFTIDFLRQNGLDYRITGYTPLQNLMNMSIKDLDNVMIEKYDRRLYYHDNYIDSELFYKILSTNGVVLL